MKVIEAIIEKASDGGYGIYTSSDELPIWGYGLTEAEARQDFLAVLEEQAVYVQQKTGQYPDWYKDGCEIKYKYDLSGFFLSYPFINVSEFAKYIGINPSLMRKYKNGLVKAGEKQKALIQEKLNEIIKNMSTVQF